MNKAEHNCDNINCNHNDTKGLCCLFNPENCKYRQLQKENAELDCQKNRNKFCYSCANATERCFKNEIGCPCDKYKSYKDENAELKKACDETQELLDKQIEATYKLDKENAELKEKLKPENCLKSLAKSGLVKFTCENGNEHDQLTKAKEIIKWFVWYFREDYNYVPYKHKVAEAEQFLNSEVQK